LEDKLKYLDPAVLSSISRLDLVAKLVVEGFISGMHKSPYHGYSVEFAQHREYVPGDDLRHVDWKVFARSDRYYIKEYEEETNLVAAILLDVSESMRYGSEGVTKYQYACYVAASLAHLIIHQQDAVALALFDQGVRRYVPPSSHFSHLGVMLNELDQIEPKKKTDMAETFHDIAERIRKRSLVIVISDFFDDPERIFAGLKHFRHRRHEVIVFQILDRYELTFPFKRMTKFIGLEQLPEQLLDPRAVREAYLEQINGHIRELRRKCLKVRADYTMIATDESLDVALSTYLSARHAGRRA